MSDQKRRAGIIYLKQDGILLDAKGNFSYNLGLPKREAIIGSTGVTGYAEKPQIPFIEGELTDSAGLNLATLIRSTSSTITLELANGKVISGSNMWYAGEGKGQTEEGNIELRFECENPLNEV